MPDKFKPTRLPGDHRLILESSRLTRDLSEDTVDRAKAAILRSRFRLKRSAERMIRSEVDATNERLRKEIDAPEAEA